MKTLWWFGACVLAGSLLNGAARAQATPLAQAVDAAWSLSVQRRSAEGQVALAAAQRSAAGSLWAGPPSVELSHRTDRAFDNAGRTESEAGLAWPVLLPGQRQARAEAAGAEQGLAAAALASAKLRVAGEVREAAWAAVAREAEAAMAQRHALGLESLADDVDRRVRAGDLARADALAARAEHLAAAAAAAEARQRFDTARAHWKTLTGLDRVPDPAEPADQAADEHPDVVAATRSLENARRKLDLVRSTRSDAPELVLRYRRDTAGGGLPADRSVGLALRIPLPTDDRNGPRERAALAEVDVAQAEAERQRLRVASDAALARSAVALAEAQLAAEARRVELLRERAGLVEKSFRAGESPLPELLRASAAAAQAEAAHAAQRAALGLARARLHQAHGVLP